MNISENFSQITDIKFVLIESDPKSCCRSSIDRIYFFILWWSTWWCVINFSENLNDGSYQVTMDDAGNRAEGIENQTFNIDTTVPEFSYAIDLGAIDLGRFKQNILYTAADSENGTIPVGKSVEI